MKPCIRKLSRLWTWTLALAALLSAACVPVLAESGGKVISSFDTAHYSVRQDFSGELGYLLKPNATVSVNAVSLPYFEGNKSTKVYFYQVSKTPQLQTHIFANEATLLISLDVALDEAAQDGWITADLKEPLVLQQGKEYLVTYVTGKFEDLGVDCLSFYNSGKGTSINPVTTTEDVRILSCTYVAPADDQHQGLYADGGIFCVDRTKPGAVFGPPNLHYTKGGSTPSGEPSKDSSDTTDAAQTTTAPSDDVVDQDDFEEVEIPRPTTTAPLADDNEGGVPTVIVVAVCVVGALVAAAVVIVVVLLVKSKKASDTKQ